MTGRLWCGPSRDDEHVGRSLPCFVDKSKDKDDYIFVTLDGGKNKEGKPVKIKCNFPAPDVDSVIKVKKGDKVKIKGELTSLGLTGNDTELEMIICHFAD
jgi:hypothetical protein